MPHRIIRKLNYWLKADNIKAKLLFALLLLAIAVILISVSLVWYDYNENRLKNLQAQITDLQLRIQQTSLREKDFFLFETINPTFYQLGKSRYLDSLRLDFEAIRKKLKKLQEAPELKSETLSEHSQTVLSQMTAFEYSFDQIVNLLKIRGFKDFGLEGDMRDFIHLVEDIAPPELLKNVLQIRRYEKDYLLRKELKYIDLVNEAVRNTKIQAQQIIKQPENLNKFVRLLDLYWQTLKALVQKENEIGTPAHTGIKKQLDEQIANINRSIQYIRLIIDRRTDAIQQNLRWGLIFLLVIVLGLLGFASFFVHQTLGRPIRDLSQAIYQVVANSLEGYIAIPHLKKRDEIGQLARDFNFMLQSLKIRHEEIKSQHEEISAQRDLLEEQNHQIMDTQQRLEETNEELMALNHNLENIVQERTQKLAKINEELDLFIYRASHDLKGPICRLLGLTQLGLLETEELIAQQYLAKIEQNVQDMDSLLDKLMMINVINQEVRRYRKITFQEIWADTENSLAKLIAKSQINLEVDFDYQAFFYSDRQLMLLIVQNLVENAIVFRHPLRQSEARVKISAINESNQFSLQVEDNGVGIAPRIQTKIFNMFYRGSELSQGNGLGLYIFKKALEELEGTFDLQSQENEYTRFVVKIPFRNKKKKVFEYSR
ncbi:MAG: HAMP domain-containing histidine kinase [Microscillaceae bacterium]|jgi:signal transduction histidine kinase|nr:HAMP domain-containing histidine kinase [Microscillaceae bacterium]